MKIIHKVSLSPNDAQRAKLDSLGISLEELTGPLAGIVSFEIDESHQAWPEVEELILGCHPVDIARTEFTASERKKASYLWMVGNSHHGYPQPEGDFGYLAASYDLTEYCAECGVGKRQVAPLRMRGEPKWGRRHILQMNWVFEEFFVRPDVWETVFKEMGIGYMPVVKHHTDKELSTVVQLDFKTTAASALQLDEDQPCEQCAHCGRSKYVPITRGPFPAFAAMPTDYIQKTQEYFGSGGSAWKAIIVSAECFQRITDRKLKGVGFHPCCRPVSDGGL